MQIGEQYDCLLESKDLTIRYVQIITKYRHMITNYVFLTRTVNGIGQLCQMHMISIYLNIITNYLYIISKYQHIISMSFGARYQRLTCNKIT